MLLPAVAALLAGSGRCDVEHCSHSSAGRGELGTVFFLNGTRNQNRGPDRHRHDVKQLRYTVQTALSRVAGVQKVEFQAPDWFLFAYDSTVRGVPEAGHKAVTALGYGVKIGG